MLTDSERRRAACRGSAPEAADVRSQPRCPEAYEDGHDHGECASCTRLGAPEVLVHTWFPARGPGLDSTGNAAKAVCRTCPVREACLLGSVEVNEQHGIFGGAGEAERRVLRRVWVADGRMAGPQYRLAAARFARSLEARGTAVVDRNGPGARAGFASSHGRGARDPWSSLAKAAVAPAPKARKGWAA